MSSERIHYLNGLRGLLALIVFLHHFLYAFCPELIFGGSYQQFTSGQWTLSRLFAFTPLNLIFNPGMAISFFFLLSGYVQSYHYFKKEEITLLQKSFLKRYFRLAVPTLAVVLLVFLFHRLNLIYKNGFPPDPLSSAWLAAMLPDNLNFLQAIYYALVNCFNGDPGYYQVLWTMSTELYNSWMVFILLLVTHRLKNKIPLFVFWIIVQALFLQSFYGISFTLGMLVCQLHLQWPSFNSVFSKPLLKIVCLVVGLYFASYPFTGYTHSTETSMYFLISFFDKFPHVVSYAFGNLLLFLFLLQAPRLKAFLSKRLLLFFGNISFMFYLVHFLILFSFSAWLYQALVPHLLSSYNLWLTGMASFGLVTLASYLLYKLVDEPVVNLCNRSVKKIFGL